MSTKKNFLYNFSYQLLIIIIPLITTPYVARVIGAKGVGIQSYTYSIANYFVLFTMLGVNNHGNRSIAMVREDKEKLSKTFWSIYSLKAIMGILMMSIYIIYIIFIVKENKIIALIQSIYIIGALLDINWFFFGMEQFKLTVIRNTIIKIMSACSIFIFVKNSEDLYLYSLILACGILISQIILWRFLFKHISFVRITIQDIVSQIKPNLILFIPVIAISIYKIMDKIMIGSMSSMIQVGFYENSEKIISIPLGVITALGAVMLPKMSNLQSKGLEDESKKYIEISMQFVMFISIGAVFGLIGVSPVLIPIFLGNEFNNCITLVSYLSITLLFLSWANVIRTQYLIPKKRDKIYITSTILGAIVNLIINALLISKYGAGGAVLGTIFAEATVCIYQTIMVRKELDIKKYFVNNVFYIIPGVIMCLIIRFIGYIFNNSSIFIGVIEIIIGCGVYLVLSLIYIIATKNEIWINEFKKLTKKFNKSKMVNLQGE